MASILKLPNELFVSASTADFCGIFNHLPKSNLKSIRGLCKRFLEESDPLFRREFFSTINVSIDWYGLSRFASIANHLQLGPCVTTVQFMFDDMSESDVYPETLRQLQRGHTVGILAQCFSKLKNCTTFLYSLRHHEDAIVAKWFSLFFLNGPYEDPNLEYAPEHVLSGWLNVTIDALFCSRLEIQRLEIDTREDCLALDSNWDATWLRKNHPGRFLSLHSALLNLNPQVQPTFVNCEILALLRPVPQSLTIRFPSDIWEEWNNAWNWQAVLESVAQLRGLQELRIEGGITYLPDVRFLGALAANNEGTLTSITMLGVQFDSQAVLHLWHVLTRLTEQNRQLVAIDLGYHDFDFMDEDGTGYTISVCLQDDDPPYVGCQLLQHQRHALKKWLVMIGLMVASKGD